MPAFGQWLYLSIKAYVQQLLCGHGLHKATVPSVLITDKAGVKLEVPKILTAKGLSDQPLCTRCNTGGYI